MKCDDIREIYTVYWKLTENDPQRAAVDQHIETCESCREEFKIWEACELMIQSELEGDNVPEEISYENKSISTDVMSRIYSNESWRMPVQDRMYAISDKLKRNLSLVLAFCLALFVGSFLFSLIGNVFAPVEQATTVSDQSIYSIQTPQTLESTSNKQAAQYNMATAVASVSQTFMDPFTFNMGPIQSYSHFLLILSILGFITAILVLNWFSRVKE
jgi:hypothetical protein